MDRIILSPQQLICSAVLSVFQSVTFFCQSGSCYCHYNIQLYDSVQNCENLSFKFYFIDCCTQN